VGGVVFFFFFGVGVFWGLRGWCCGVFFLVFGFSWGGGLFFFLFFGGGWVWGVGGFGFLFFFFWFFFGVASFSLSLVTYNGVGVSARPCVAPFSGY